MQKPHIHKEEHKSGTFKQRHAFILTWRKPFKEKALISFRLLPTPTFPHSAPLFASTFVVLHLFKDNTNGNTLRFIKPSRYVIVSSSYEEYLSITEAPRRAMNVVLRCCQMQNPQGLGVRIKAFEEVKTDEKLYSFIGSHLLSGHWILEFYISMPTSRDNGLRHCWAYSTFLFLKKARH